MTKHLSSHELDKRRLLGLRGSAEASDGSRVMVGSKVRISGEIMRIHSSGFVVVKVNGVPQNAVIMNARNVEPLKERDNADA